MLAARFIPTIPIAYSGIPFLVLTTAIPTSVDARCYGLLNSLCSTLRALLDQDGACARSLSHHTSIGVGAAGPTQTQLSC